MHTKIRQCGRRKAGRTSVLYFAAETKKLGNTLQGLKITLKVSFNKSRAKTKHRRLPIQLSSESVCTAVKMIILRWFLNTVSEKGRRKNNAIIIARRPFLECCFVVAYTIPFATAALWSWPSVQSSCAENLTTLISRLLPLCTTVQKKNGTWRKYY